MKNMTIQLSIGLQNYRLFIALRVMRELELLDLTTLASDQENDLIRPLFEQVRILTARVPELDVSGNVILTPFTASSTTRNTLKIQPG